MKQDALITWDSIKALLPHDLSALAKGTGSVSRWRKVTSGEQLLWLCLVYARAFMSLRATAGQSVPLGGLTEGAVKHRLAKAGPFLSAILAHILNASVARMGDHGVRRAVRLVDSTSLSVPGSTGTDWRVHTAYVFGRGFTDVDVEDSKGAESTSRARCRPGDIWVTDQGYGSARELHHARSVGAYSLTRVYLRNIRLCSVDGQRLPFEELLDRADAGDTSSTAYVPFPKSDPLKVRVIIRPLSPEKAEAARKKLRARSSRKQNKVTAKGLRLAGYFVLLTTVPNEDLSDDEALQLYRLRWQIELLFKRWKSLLDLDKLNAAEPALVRTFCLSKLIEAALIERFGVEAIDDYASSSEHDDDERPACTMWRITVVYHAAFEAAVFTAFPLSRAQVRRAMEAMREGKRRRKNASTITAVLFRRLSCAEPAREAA